jgi:hypothetical protein
MVRTRFKFDNSRDGFEWALENARVEIAKTGSRGVIFAIETGAHYWRIFAYFLEERHTFPVNQPDHPETYAGRARHQSAQD